ncbi:MAG: cobyrinate a,c-diamide synthase [Actinomycetota bacterium]
MAATNIPRVVVAGTHSGVGKTTVATGLMAAFRARDVAVASAKIGPDFIDPGFHSVATARAPRNLDAWICGLDAMAPLAARAGQGVDLLVIEGVMGLYDGAVDGAPSSTADVAIALNAPVVLVVDGSAMSGSVAAMVRGYRDHDPSVSIVGVILNRVSNDRHRQLLTEALDAIGVDVLGSLASDDAMTWRDRHLGLVPVEERPAEVAASIDRLASIVAGSCDLDSVARAANAAAPLDATSVALPRRVAPVRVAVAAGRAFTFVYRDNVEALEAAGAEVVSFDPLRDERLPPDIDGLIVGGGFPEVFVERLADNRRLLDDVKAAIERRVPTWAECGGLLWLARALDDRPLVGAVPAAASMTERLTLGYRRARALAPNPVLPVGATARGHEFHYSEVQPSGDALELVSRFGQRTEGFASPTLLATYLHQHLGADPSPAVHFVAACAMAASRKSRGIPAPGA